MTMDDDFFIRVLVAIVVVLLVWLCLDFLRLGKSRWFSFWVRIKLYVIRQFRYWRGWKDYITLLRNCRRFNEIQQTFLVDHLQRCSQTLYGRQHKFTTVKTIADYVTSIPMTSYDHYEELITRMIEGETNLLIPDDVYMFCSSSGTTGKSKYIPTTEWALDRYDLIDIGLEYLPVSLFGTRMRSLQPIFRIFFPVKYTRTQSGKDFGPLSGKLRNFFWTPLELTLPDIKLLNGVTDSDCTYIHLLFGLREKGITKLEATFVTTVQIMFSRLEEKWQSLVQDIERGQLSETEVNVTPESRRRINSYLKPDPRRASELKREFECGFVNITTRIWPDLKMINTITSGSFQVYGELLRSSYARDVTIHSPALVSSEVLYGVNIWFDRPTPEYVLLADMAFWEFIPFDVCDSPDPPTLTADQVTAGQLYEMVITNTTGFYRYRTGDVVLVSRFVSLAPVLQFQFRKGQLLSIRGEKTSETDIYTSLKSAAAISSATVADYACTESPLYYKARGLPSVAPPHYVIFADVTFAGTKSSDWLKELQNKMEAELCKNAPSYNRYRQRAGIGVCKLLVVPDGAFQRLRQHRLQTTSVSANQIKAMRLLNCEDHIQFLMQGALE